MRPKPLRKPEAAGGWRLAFIALLASLVLSSGCASRQSSTAGPVLLQLAPVGLDLFALPAKLELKVSNPSKLTVSVSKISFAVIIEGLQVAVGGQSTPVIIGAEGSQVISLPLAVFLYRPQLVSLVEKGVKYQVRGSYAIVVTSEQTFTAASLLKPLLHAPQNLHHR